MSTDQPTPPNPAPSRMSHVAALPIWSLVVAAVAIAALGFGVGFLAGHGGRGDGYRGYGPFRGAYAEPGRGTIGGIPRIGTFPRWGPGSTGGTTVTPFGEILGGTVTKVQGDSLTLHTFRGQTVTVHTSDSTFVRLAGGATIADLKPGSVVFVTGTEGADGSLSASRVLGGFVQPSTGTTTP